MAGIVIEASYSRKRPEVVYLRVADTSTKTGVKYTGLLVEKSPEGVSIDFGDAVWWTSSALFWTPFFHKSKAQGGVGGIDYDIEVKRISNAGINHPDFPKEN